MPDHDVRRRTNRLDRVLAEINRAGPDDFALGSRVIEGVTETWLVRTSRGRRAVLKVGRWSVDHLRRAATVVGSLRSHGYPTPAWLLVGELEDGPTYHLQEFIPGEPVGPLTVPTARMLADLINSQAGLDPWPGRDWSAYVTADLAVAADDLRQCAPATVPLVERYEELVAALGPVSLPGGDLVHGDFHRRNVLLHPDLSGISGVIDIEACGSGSRVIDFAWLLRDAYTGSEGEPAARRVIRKAGEAVAGPDALAYCVAVTALDVVRWHAHQTPADFTAMLPGLHRLANDLARPIGLTAAGDC